MTSRPATRTERDPLGAVAALATDIERRAFEQARQAFAEEKVIIRQRHPRTAGTNADDYPLPWRHVSVGTAGLRGMRTRQHVGPLCLAMLRLRSTLMLLRRHLAAPFDPQVL